MPKQISITLWVRLIVAALLLSGIRGPAHASDDFLEPEVAFKLSARAVGARTAEVILSIAPGYYLYREQFKFSAEGVSLGSPVLPAGKTKFDETFQKTVETYRDEVRISIPVEQAGSRFQLLVTNQGCADKGLCYPPQQRSVELSLAGFGGDGSAHVLATSDPRATVPDQQSRSTSVQLSAKEAPSTGALDGALRGGRFWPVIGVFFVAGILLSLTPCVLPMLPILSSIIVGHGAQVSRARGLALAVSYSLGMAMVYTALGVAAGLAGEGLAATLQTPWVLGAFAVGLIALSLSMFGAYELQLPSAITGHLSQATRQLPAGHFASVFLMGGVSALIVSPCVAAPLAGALVYLSQTRDVWLGGTALFSLAAGMSVPLLLIGASAGALLPRAGAWMEDVKRFFGLLLLGVALWTVQSVFPAPLVLALWGALAILLAIMLASPGPGHHGGHAAGNWTQSLWRRALGAVVAVCGLLQLIGAAAGGTNPLQPLAHLARSVDGTSQGPMFTMVRSVAELDAVLIAAGRPVLLDFYADWCVSCKEMERFTFVDPEVQQRMRGAVLLKADVTSNNALDRELLKRFQLFGPPGTIFFDAKGKEVISARLVGFQDRTGFLKTLQAAGL